MVVYIFFFKQKTAYEMRISDWSSDVCSSDLQAIGALSAAIKLARAGLREPGKPIGCYLFSGPTGVGKTEAARQLALSLGIELTRFDMSEYKLGRASCRERVCQYV